MKTICEWDKCNNLGEFKAQLKRIIVKNIECFV